MTSSFMAIDQYGQTHHGLRYPRKDLLSRLGKTRAEKMYVDTTKGPVHVGYVIGGLWLSVYSVGPFKERNDDG